MTDQIVLDVKNLKQHFPIGSGRNKTILKAVDGVNFQVRKGEVFSLVGESGCGKTTTGRSLIGLYDITDGEVNFLDTLISAGDASLREEKYLLRKNTKKSINELKSQITEDNKTSIENKILSLKEEEASKIREINNKIKAYKKANHTKNKEIMNKMQMIFQDPIASLNPRMTVKEIIAEGLRIGGEKNEQVITKKVNDALDRVGLLPEHSNRYPHEFSGGQRQRIGIARALIIEPEFIIADEPISALDISIQAQVINLLNDLREELGITILFIAHDLSVVKYFSDRIAVMYYGKIVELGNKDDIFANPVHPYTKSLLSAIPFPDPHYEQNRPKRIIYNSSMHDYSIDKPEMVEIRPNHFVYANKKEVEEYNKELNNL